MSNSQGSRLPVAGLAETATHNGVTSIYEVNHIQPLANTYHTRFPHCKSQSALGFIRICTKLFLVGHILRVSFGWTLHHNLRVNKNWNYNLHI